MIGALPLPEALTSMRIRRILTSLLVGATLAGCADLNVTNPNEPSTESFWKTPTDALAGTNAVYAGLLPLGTYGRWQAFNLDLRSDIGSSKLSPNGDLANYIRFVLNNYNVDWNRHTWVDHFNTIFRANQAIANIPNISMDEALRDRYVAEAKFIRGLLYYNLINLYGENIPLITEPIYDPAVRPGSSTAAAIYAQIEKDLTDAAAVLPASYPGTERGRATKGAALAVLGKARLQQHKYPEAETVLQQVVDSRVYSLRSNYADNFIEQFDASNDETVFEVQSGDESTLSRNIPGLSFARMIGPWRYAFHDAIATRWYLNEFLAEKTTTLGIDPRAEATLYWNHVTTETPYGHPYSDIFQDDGGTPFREDTLVYFKKYGEYYAPGDFQRWDNPINYKVVRYADVLLMLAEAQNEQSKTGPATTNVNLIRNRAKLASLGTLNQTQLRTEIMHQRALEFGLEGQRWFDLVRWNLFNAANLPTLQQHDDDFNTFVIGKSERLPIPIQETILNPNIHQNPGY
jgi:hypothetical protein